MDERNIRLHFEGPKTAGHTVPAQVMVRALENIQQIVYLLAKQERGDVMKQRARVSRQIERTFSLICQVPENGGYALPQEIGDASDDFFEESEIKSVANKFAKLSEAIEAGDHSQVSQIVSDQVYRSAILKRYKAAQPSKRSGLLLSIEDYKQQRLLGGKDVLEKIARIDSAGKVHELGETPGYLIGTLVKMDFVQRSLSLKLLNGRTVQAFYQEDFEPTLLENARGQIQIHGNIQYDEKNDPILISDVDDVVELDLSTITIKNFDLNETSLSISPALSFEIDLDEESGVMSAEGDFGILVCAETRSALEDEIEEALQMLWVEYAQEKDDALSPRAILLAKDLRERISEISS
ncbi:hypothetical protein [Tritonibacter mobilis]|uniref:hypothetical protein n=1 Tax=Tritonibacter mobilis TaxID=379347 RepID=UPI000806B706|nr:hypothetical protein [Tritonibacter mobilis]GLP85734.1 hypothetical protein GCM10007921_12940 [Tritonibacter mobilis]SDX06641.1 hypothetical protein SAMN05444385_104411 [Tritonibacter mobilis]